jgi:hypothetical protein
VYRSSRHGSRAASGPWIQPERGTIIAGIERGTDAMTWLSDLVQTSATVGTTSARLAKVRAIAAQLRALDADEIAIAAQ